MAGWSGRRSATPTARSTTIFRTPAPAKPSWLYDARSSAAAAIRRASTIPNCTLGNWNWLGTDDQARDVLARVIYGFRISVLFGLIADDLLGGHRRRGRRRAGLFRRLDRPALPALHRDLVVDPGALSAADHRRGAAAELLRPARHHAAVLLGRRWSASCGPSSCAPATSNMSTRRARSACRNRTIMFRHLLPNAMVATLTFLPFILNGSITTLTSLDFLGFGLPPGSPRSANCWRRASATSTRRGSASPASSSSR